MRRIKQIEALDILIAWTKTGFYKIDLNYGLIPPKQETPGEDGYSLPAALPGAQGAFTQSDFLGPEYGLCRSTLTIATLHSRN